MTISVFNLSHPLSDAAEKKLQDMIGGDIEIHHFPIHLDIKKSISDQLVNSCISPILNSGHNKDYIYVIFPGYSNAAAVLSSVLTKMFGKVYMIVMVRDDVLGGWVPGNIEEINYGIMNKQVTISI